MKIGLFFGSFNPIHNGHLALARHFATLVDEVWLVVSPQNPLKKLQHLWHDQLRLQLAQAATHDIPKIRVSDVEFNLPKPSYTFDTLTFLQSQYPDNQFVLIVGSDNVALFEHWYKHDEILQKFAVWAYPRQGFPSHCEQFPQIRFIDAPLYNLSATEIRKKIAQNEPIDTLVPEPVLQMLQPQNLKNFPN